MRRRFSPPYRLFLHVRVENEATHAVLEKRQSHDDQEEKPNLTFGRLHQRTIERLPVDTRRNRFLESLLGRIKRSPDIP